MATTKIKDIRETGPQSYRDLQRENRQQLQGVEQENPFLRLKPSNPYRSSVSNIYEGGEMSPLQQSGEDYWGRSQYDNPTANEEEYQAGNMGDTRYENQAWYDTLANGVGKMLGTAGTTFISSLIGLPYGLFEAANQGRWSALWDNDVTQGLSDVDKWLEQNMTNYRSQIQQNSPWYDPNNLFSMNFIADDVIKNMGFTLGAAASMAVGSGALGLMSKSLGFVNEVSNAGKMANNVISALFSATGEGMIEARQGVEERNKLEMQKLDDALAPEAEALRMEFDAINQEYEANRGKSLVRGTDGRMYDPAYEIYKTQMEDLGARRDNLNQRREAGRKQIEESGLEMGNKILLGNQALLTAGNLIQFSKAMTKSFDKARHAAEQSSKYAKPRGVNASRVSSNIRDGYRVSSPVPGRFYAATKGILTEGSEEMNQQMIQSTSGASSNEIDVNDYWRAKMDPESYRETTKGLYTLGQFLDRGFNESWGDVNQWEQFVIGGLTGMTGSYSPTKLFNQDKTKSVWNPMRYGSWEGGAFNEISDFNKEYNQYKENIDDLNKILQSEDFPARVRSMVGHTYTEQEKQFAAENDDKKAFKDADDKQNIHDIQAFLRVGKLDDLRAIYEEMGGTLSDEDVENIIKSTTREVTAEEDKQQHDQQIDAEIAKHQRKISQLQEKAQDIADQQDTLTPEERSGYQAAVSPALENIFADIDKEYDAISELEQQKATYVPQKHYEGAYVDREGNKTATPDEIRAEHQHNAEELNRKLDSYLESIDYVNRRTNGQLTKDQEDNLAYLHNMGKESNVRMQKIMAGVRQQLPKKFLLKTNKTPEQLTQEYASSDLSFSKDEKTKEGYVEVDTSLMNDASFADFFQREIMRGGNIRPEFAETADERAAREEEEKNLPEEEKKKKARERVSKKWQNTIKQMQDDAGEQWDTNWKLLVDNFMDNYRVGNGATLDETIEAFGKVRQDLQDASDLYDQAGEFQRTLMEYMQNPSKVDEAKEKEEKKADKTQKEQSQSNQFEGKDAKQMTQELANGVMDEDEFFDFANMDLSGDAPQPLQDAQQEAKKAQEIRQRQAAMKNHIQEQLGENPTPQDLEVAELAMQMVDNAALNAENPDDLNIDMPELNQVPMDAVDPNASIDDIDNLNQSVQNMLADAFNAMEEDRNARNDIPNTAPVAGEEEGAETGHDPVTKTVAETAVPINGTAPQNQNGPIIPSSSGSSNAATEIVPKSPLTEGAVNTIMDAMSKVYSNPATAGTWRSTTTRHPYGKSTGTYHEDIAKQQFGEDSKEYKRSKAIWEYLNAAGAFDRMENTDADRIKAGDTIHFMVKYLPQVFGKNDFKDLTEEEKPYAMVILMLNDNGEVLGDLPLAELEPSYKTGNPTQQVKDLMSLQKKVFDAFANKKQNSTANEMVVDSMSVDGADNLNLTFDNAKKTPLVSKVKQVMRGVVPFSKTEKHTLNEVANGQPFELGVKVTGTTVAKKKGDKTQHKEIVIPGVGSTGQPYLLMKTASGEQMAVPFYMPMFNPEQHKTTELYKLLSNAIYHMLANNNQSTRGKEAYRKHMDVIEGLLQVKAGEGKRVIEVTPDHIALHFVSLTDPNQEINIQITKTQSLAQDAQSLVNQLAGIPINVSLQFLNDKIETGLDTGDKYTRSYNQVIGEIADINLPQNTQHTVNSWFTVELAPAVGIKPSKKVQPRITGTYTETVSGKTIEFDTDNLIATDVSTGEIIVDDPRIDLMLAEIQSNKPINRGKERIQVSINGQLYTYDTQKKQFVKTPNIKLTPQQERVNRSKLLNKEYILDVTNGTEGLEVELSPKVLSEEFLRANPDAQVLITEHKGKLESIIQNTKEAVYLSDEQMQPIIDKFVPKEIQDYVKEGRKKEQQALIELSDRMRAENPDVKIADIVEAQNKLPNLLRDKYGIPFVNEYEGIIPATSSASSAAAGAASFETPAAPSSIVSTAANFGIKGNTQATIIKLKEIESKDPVTYFTNLIWEAKTEDELNHIIRSAQAYLNKGITEEQLAKIFKAFNEKDKLIPHKPHISRNPESYNGHTLGVDNMLPAAMDAGVRKQNEREQEQLDKLVDTGILFKWEKLSIEELQVENRKIINEYNALDDEEDKLSAAANWKEYDKIVEKNKVVRPELEAKMSLISSVIAFKEHGKSYFDYYTVDRKLREEKKNENKNSSTTGKTVQMSTIAQGAVGFEEDAQFQEELDAAVQYVTNHPQGSTFNLSKTIGVFGDRLRAIIKALTDQYGMSEWDGDYRMPSTWLSETMTAGLGSAFGEDSAMANQIKESNSNWMNNTVVKDTWKSEYKESLALSKKDSLTPKEFLDALKKKYANSQDLLRRLKSIEKYNMDEFSAIIESINQPETPSTPIDILVAWAEGKLPQETAFKLLEGTDYVKTTKPNPVLHTGGGTHFTNKVEIELGKYIHEKYPFLTTGNVKVNTGVSTFGGDVGLIIVRDPEGIEYGTPSNFLRSLTTGGERSTGVIAKYTANNPLAESLEQVNQRMKDNKVVGRQTKDAWDAIPDDLKIKLANEDALLQLSYGDKKATISMRNLPAMKEALKEANMAAKAGSLTVTEAAKPMEKDAVTLSRENEQAARRWLAKNLPMLSSEERTQFVDRLARMGDNAGKYWGSYRSGVIQIQKNAPMGTVYHEAFHYVLDMVLSPEERMEVLNIAKEEYGIDDIYAAEERLANDFRRYAMDENAIGIMGRIKRWIRKIADRINRYNRISEPTINQLFWKINNGELAQKSQEVESFEDQQQKVLMEIRNVQKENLAWNNLSRETKAALKDSGLSEAAYSDMSLEEKQQYVRCRG